MKKRLFPLMMLAMSLLGSIGVFANEGGDSGANTGGMGSWWIWIIIYGGMFAIFYFLLIRPNKRSRKQKKSCAITLRLEMKLPRSAVSAGV